MLLEVTALTRAFQGRRILGPIDVRLEGGERLALSGPNGAGKSTLLRCIAGTVAPTTGTVTIGGARAGTRTARRWLGASFSQERSFYLRLTGRQNLITFAELRVGADQARREVDALIAELELEQTATKVVSRCSSGMVQQLSFARALLTSPKLLLLDEPSRSLDTEALERMWAAIDRRSDAAVIIATHREEDIERCERRLDLSPL